MADVTVTWYGDRVLAAVEAAVARGMETAGKALAASTRQRVSTPYPPASRPGNPPHRRSGGLHGAIGHKVTRTGRAVVLSVGVPASSPIAQQARALQKGTGRMAARPYLPAAEHSATTVVGYVAGAVREQMGRG